MTKRVAVLGAGLSGLASAWKLAKDGIKTEIIEQESVVGGLSSTIRKEGYMLDFGPHPFYTDRQEILGFVFRLLEGKVRKFDRHCLLHFHGRFVNYPPSVKNVLFNLGLKISFCTTINYFYTQVRQALISPKEDNFEDWCINKFGRYFFNIFFSPYTERFWGMPPRNLTTDLASARVSKMNFIKVVKSLFSKNVVGSPQSQIDRDMLPLYYPFVGGIGSLAESIAKDIRNSGGRIHTGSAVKKVSLIDAGRSMVTLEDGEKRQEIEVDGLISTIPVTELVASLDSPVPEEVRQSAGKLDFRSLLILYLVLPRRNILNSCYVYYAQRTYHRITELTKFSPYVCPDKDNLLSVEISCDYGDDMWQMKENEVFERCIEQLEKDKVVSKEEVKRTFLLKTRYAYPIYKNDYSRHLSCVMDYLQGLDNFRTIGRQGRFNYMDMDQSIEDGFNAAVWIQRNLKL